MKYILAIGVLVCLATAFYAYLQDEILKSILFILLAWMNAWGLERTQNKEPQL